jgi:hypothetical protein
MTLPRIVDNETDVIHIHTLVLIASRPHRLTATVSGHDPLLPFPPWSAADFWCCARMASAIAAPRSMAAGEGMR